MRNLPIGCWTSAEAGDDALKVAEKRDHVGHEPEKCWEWDALVRFVFSLLLDGMLTRAAHAKREHATHQVKATVHREMQSQCMLSTQSPRLTEWGSSLTWSARLNTWLFRQ